MTKLTTTLLSSAAALLLAGNAFAVQPAAGEHPLWNESAPIASSVQRTDVRADASRQMPASGEMSAQGASSGESALSRAEVRQSVREAFANGFRPAVGERV